MAVKDIDFVDVLAVVDEISEAQTYKLLLAMKQCPADGIDPVREATACFEALTDLEVHHFFREMRKRYDADDWSVLTED